MKFCDKPFKITRSICDVYVSSNVGDSFHLIIKYHKLLPYVIA